MVWGGEKEEAIKLSAMSCKLIAVIIIMSVSIPHMKVEGNK